jgi:glycosyltransferase involved in cell wall biosynthesis
VSHVIPYPPKAGVLLRAYHLLKGVAQRADVDLFAFIQEPWLKTLFSDRDAGLQECRSELQRFCRTVHFEPIARIARPYGQLRTAAEALFERESYVQGWLRSDSAENVLRRMRAESQYDLVHFDTIALARYRPLFDDITATLGHHNIESEMLARRAENEENRVKRWYFRREGRRLRQFEQRTAAQFASHITCSELDSERLRALVPAAHTHVVPNGVDCDYFQPQGLATRPDSLIFVGTMNWYPNVDAVLFLLRELWPALRRARPSVTLDLVGANVPESVKALAAQSAGVTVHGFVPEVRPMIESAAVYVCPIRDGGGTKLKILDACAMASCIVAHPIAIEGIDVVDGRQIVLASSAEEMVAQILRLLDNAVLRREIGQSARALMQERYSFAAIGASLAQHFTELAAANSA